MFIGPVHTQDKKEKLRVLIADDVMETRRSTRLMMTLIPEVEVVAIAHNGRQALEMSLTHNPDICLMDVQMPEMDGITAIKEMLFHRPELACVVISAERDRHTLHKAMKVGARDFIIKPYTSDQITKVMQRVITMVRAQTPPKKAPKAETTSLNKNRKAQLQTLAGQYLRSRRTDDETLAILEELATDPLCDLNWLTALSMVYLVRRQWHDLKRVAERLEKLESKSNPSIKN
ncbi:MAG: response regulator [Chloroflexi bacterium]|nr:MAG: response regulator [Chloroflexota bacterium]